MSYVHIYSYILHIFTLGLIMLENYCTVHGVHPSVTLTQLYSHPSIQSADEHTEQGLMIWISFLDDYCLCLVHFNRINPSTVGHMITHSPNLIVPDNYWFLWFLC
jgi:hypothetical protein